MQIRRENSQKRKEDVKEAVNSKRGVSDTALNGVYSVPVRR